MTAAAEYDAEETLREIVDSDLFRDKLFANANIVVAENRAYALRAKQPLDWLSNDIATHLWERRHTYNHAKASAQTWAKQAAKRRLIDLVRSAETKTAQKLLLTPDVPDRPAPIIQELSVTNRIDFENRLAALAYIAKCCAAINIPPTTRKGPRPFTDSQLAAILVIRMDRNDTLRGVLHRLQASSSLRDELGIDKSTPLPSWMVLWRASLRWWGRDFAIAYLLNESKKLMGELKKEMES